MTFTANRQRSLGVTQWAIILALAAASAPCAEVIVRPVEIHDVLVNPGMGIQTFQRYNGDALNPGVEWSEAGPVQPLVAPGNKPDFPASTVAYCRWHWSTI